jgi:hypothetical protein
LLRFSTRQIVLQQYRGHSGHHFEGTGGLLLAKSRH